MEGKLAKVFDTAAKYKRSESHFYGESERERMHIWNELTLRRQQRVFFHSKGYFFTAKGIFSRQRVFFHSKRYFFTAKGIIAQHSLLNRKERVADRFDNAVNPG